MNLRDGSLMGIIEEGSHLLFDCHLRRIAIEQFEFIPGRPGSNVMMKCSRHPSRMVMVKMEGIGTTLDVSWFSDEFAQLDLFAISVGVDEFSAADTEENSREGDK